MFYDKRLPQDYEDILITLGKHPHWDLAILHAPGECQMCDYVPDLQAYRAEHNICFTGEVPTMPVEGSSRPLKAPCWSGVGRTIQEVYFWKNNRPVEYPAPKAGGGG